MSMPITVCLIRKAVTDAQALRDLCESIEYAIRHDGLVIYGCRHDPPCEQLTDEEAEMLKPKIDRMVEEMATEKLFKEGEVGNA